MGDRALFERFTDRARQVVVFAAEEARTLCHDCIGTEHLLLGLLRDEEGLAARLLESYDVSLDAVRAQIIRVIGEGDEAVTSGQIPFTERATKALEASMSEAVSLGDGYVAPEHILLGLVIDDESVAARILVSFDADAEKIRGEVIRLTGELDRALARAWVIFLEELSDESDEELGALLPPLIDAGYVVIDGRTPSGHLWRFTPAGVERAAALGLD